MQAQIPHHHPAPAYGQQPAYAAAPVTPSLPYTPLPKRRGTAPTVALVAVALVIPALIFGLPALLGDDDGAGGSDQVATEPEGKNPEGTDPEGTDPQIDGPTVEGAGYVYTVPDGWGRRPDMVREFSLDKGDSVVAVSRPDHGFDTNVLVTANAADGFTSVDDAREAWLPEDGTVEELEPTTLDGVEAIGVRNETVSDAGRPIVQLGYLSLRDGQLYSIVLSVPVQSESDSQAALDAVLASWTWGEREPATGESAPSTA